MIFLLGVWCLGWPSYTWEKTRKLRIATSNVTFHTFLKPNSTKRIIIFWFSTISSRNLSSVESNKNQKQEVLKNPQNKTSAQLFLLVLDFKKVWVFIEIFQCDRFEIPTCELEKVFFLYFREKKLTDFTRIILLLFFVMPTSVVLK